MFAFHVQTLNIQAEFRDKIIFCAIDRLESLKGIPLKLLGLERFLLRCPQWVGKIVLIQIGISAYERGDDFVKTRKEILTIVENINSIWPGTVHFKECAESQMKLQQRLALLRAADVCMVTSIRDGLNLIPLVSATLEYILRFVSFQVCVSYFTLKLFYENKRNSFIVTKTL